jgi:hypothetical protein
MFFQILLLVSCSGGTETESSTENLREDILLEKTENKAMHKFRFSPVKASSEAGVFSSPSISLSLGNAKVMAIAVDKEVILNTEGYVVFSEKDQEFVRGNIYKLYIKKVITGDPILYQAEYLGSETFDYSEDKYSLTSVVGWDYYTEGGFDSTGDDD